MVCISPRRLNDVSVPCSKCAACNYNYRRGWQSRLEMESKLYDSDHQAFVTLTYSEVPLTPDFQPTLRKSDLQKFFKRCRKDKYIIRYLAVGEYGDKGGRPHYHAIIFGPTVQEIQRMCSDHWPHGHNLVVPVLEGATSYVAKYIVKQSDHDLGTYPLEGSPFMLSSRRPGIGVIGLKEMGERYKHDPTYQILENTGDISTIYRSNGKWRSLPARDARIVRESAGVPLKASDRPDKPPRENDAEEIEKAKRFLSVLEAKKRFYASF